MKSTIALLATVVFLLIFDGCSEKAPSVRVKNERDNKANVQFKQSDGNTINQNDVQPGAYSNFQDISPGIINVAAVMQNDDNADQRFVATNDHNYTIVLVAGDPFVIRVDEQSK